MGLGSRQTTRRLTASILCAMFACAAVSASAAAAQPGLEGDPPQADTPPDVPALELFKETWQAAADWTIPENIHFTYRTLQYAQLTDEELAAAEARIEGHPDHPDRDLVRRERRRRANGPDPLEYEVWFKKQGSWRINWSEPTRKLPVSNMAMYVDRVSMPDVIWAMTENSLDVIQPSAIPPGRDHRRAEKDVVHDLLRYVWGGMGRINDPESSFEAHWAQDRLIATLSNPKGYKIRWTASWSDEAERLLTESREIVASLSSHPNFAPGVALHFDDWRFEPLLGQWVAGRVEKYNPDGTLRFVHEFGSVEPLSEGVFLAVTTIPTDHRADAVRGDVTYTSVRDFRPRSMRLSMTTIDGERLEKPIPESMLGATAASGRVWRAVGWTAAVVVAIALVCVSVWNRRRRAGL